MKKTLVAAAMLLSATVANASELPFFAGANIGMNTEEPYVYSGGINAGYNVMSVLGVTAAVEGTYDIGVPKDAPATGDRNITHTFGVNAIPTFAIPGMGISVYGLGGIGYRINSDDALKNFGVYNLGAGVKYAVTSNIDADLRFKRTEAIDEANMPKAENRVTVGVQYKF